MANLISLLCLWAAIWYQGYRIGRLKQYCELLENYADNLHKHCEFLQHDVWLLKQKVGGDYVSNYSNRDGDL